jgi:hypothetical protein
MFVILKSHFPWKIEMKQTGNTHRRTSFNSWQHQSQIKNPVLHRIRNITSELEAIQSEMHRELSEPARENRPAKFFEDSSAVQALNDFKVELDQLRRILWFYIEEAARKSGTRMELEQQANRVTELLRTLSPKAPASAAGEGAPSASFFERLDIVIDTYMQEKKPVAQVKTAKASGH